MNYAALRYVVEQARVDGAAWQVLVVIAYRADKHTGQAPISRRRLATEARVSTGTVHYVLDDLIGRGVLEVVIEGSGRRSMIYRIVVPHDASGSTVEPKPESPVEPLQPVDNSVDNIVDNTVDNSVVAQSESRSGSTDRPVVAQWAGRPIGRRENRREDLEGTSAAALAASADPTADAVGGRSAERNGRVPQSATAELAKLRAETTAKRIAAQQAERQRLERLHGPASSEPDARDPPAQLAL